MKIKKRLILGVLAGLKVMSLLVLSQGVNGPLGDFVDRAKIWENLNAQAATFYLEEGQLYIRPERLPPYASVWFAFKKNRLNASSPILTEEDLTKHAAHVERLIKEGFTLNVQETQVNFPVQLEDIEIQKDGAQTTLQFEEAFMEDLLKQAAKLKFIPPKNVQILRADTSTVNKVELSGQIADGQELVKELSQTLIEAALRQGETEAKGVTQGIKGRVVNNSGLNLGPLEWIGEGRSNFEFSSPDREYNIRKAVNQHFNGILIPPGAEFSYLEFLGPIEYGGWRQAYTIFKGTQLERAPAGGVCQVSTTVYRAALDAGLEITEQRNHSLYIIYYEDYGDGLDATVFPEEQDLKFINNTNEPILILAETEGENNTEVVIRFYGANDGRETTLIGPYTASNQTEESRAAVGVLGIGNMAWKYRITKADGSFEEQWLVSDYMSPAQQHKEPAAELEYLRD